MNVPVGPTSAVGYTTTAAGWITTLIIYLTGHGGGDTQLAEMVSAGVGAVALIVTQVGRYMQAIVAARHAPPAPAVPVPLNQAAVSRANLPGA